jgi:translation elongation factor EF-Tu-like GTPase
MPHLRVDGGQYLGVVFRSDAASTLEPGATGTVTVDLLYDVDYGVLKTGARFDVLEGSRSVGTGQIL